MWKKNFCIPHVGGRCALLSNRRLNCDRKPIVGDYCIRNSVKVTNSSLYCELRGTDNVPEKKYIHMSVFSRQTEAIVIVFIIL